MELVDGQLILSATDLINYLECGHLTWLDRERAEGLLSDEPKRPETAELVATKGDEHEVAYLEGLKAEYGEALVEIATDGGRPGLERAGAEAAGAIVAGCAVIC